VVRVFLQDDIDVIAKKIVQEAPQKENVGGQVRCLHESVHVDHLGEWPTDVQLRKRFGVSTGFCGYWANRKSRINPRRKALRSKPIPNIHHNKARAELRGFFADDAKNILAGNESKAPGSGRGPSAKRLRADGAQRIKNAMLGILAEATRPPLTGYVLEKGLALGFSEYLMRKALDLYALSDKGDRTNSRVWRPLDEEKVNGQAPKPEPMNGQQQIKNSPKRRGRQTGWRSNAAASRNAEMIAAWKTGKYDTPTDLGRAFNVDLSYARKLVRSLRSAGK
jgi:hypothetical protein